MRKGRPAKRVQVRWRKQLKRRARLTRRSRPARSSRQGLSVGATRRTFRRREFLAAAASTGALLAAPSFLGGCHHEDVEPGTLFFNLSHLDASKTYFLTGGGRSYRLTRVGDDPDLLVRARRGNSFLRGVPDQQITHHIAGTSFDTGNVSLVYLSSDIDTGAGTWSMSAVYVQIPLESVGRAYQGARARTPTGPLPLSAKRKMYGIPPAQTEQDLREEMVLLDVNTQAAAILGSSPDLFSLDSGSANHIHTNHINNGDDAQALAQYLATPQFGPATPQQGSGTNAVGWGTLIPVIDDATKLPFKNTKGTHAGRNQYIPVFHPDIAQFVADATDISFQVKDDATLGADVTGLNPESNDPPDPALAGAMWARRDGSSSVIQAPGGPQAGDAIMTLVHQGPQNGLEVMPTVTGTKSQPQVSAKLVNWYVRYLGIWLQFIAADGVTVLNLADIPEYVAGTIVPGHENGADTKTEMFVGILGSTFTILGIPTWPGFTTSSFNVPASASTVRILASGIGTGASNYPGTLEPGAAMTGIVNYGITSLLCAIGAAGSVGLIMKELAQFASPLAQELIVYFASDFNIENESYGSYFEAQALALVKAIIQRDVGVLLKKLVELIVPVTAEAVAEDSIPIAGWILLGISVAAGVATLLETTIEIAESPWTYVNDLVFTHDLSVSLLKDPSDGTFPADADHLVMTALFDDGTPYVQTQQLPKPIPATLSPVVFNSVPLGGQVEVSVAFYQAGAGGSELLLGKGTTGRFPNDANGVVPAITLEEVRYPIDSSTVYEHKQKTALDSGGNHVWDPSAPAPTVNGSNLNCGGAGTLCNFQDITVRQGTSAEQGYVGYAWEGQSNDPSKGAACGSGATGQFDQLANLNTGPDAQNGYLAGPCGFATAGVKVTYSLLSHGAENFYLDTSNMNALHLRQVTLDPPGYAPPSSSNPQTPSPSWGVLNFLPDSLLLHPAGYIVSINNVNHKMETLRIPRQPMDDADALVQLLAQVKSGMGSRPGLMTSPVAAAVAPDGTILVLERGDPEASPVVPARIQAFDLGANPKRFFPNQPSPYSLQLTATPNVAGWQYLDVAVEYGGLIYVLSQLEGAYQLDIYQPGQTGTAPLCTTTAFNAAKIAVDFWRNLYALNYEVIRVQGGGTPGFTEPSISLWTPNSSCTGANCSP